MAYQLNAHATVLDYPGMSWQKGNFFHRHTIQRLRSTAGIPGLQNPALFGNRRIKQSEQEMKTDSSFILRISPGNYAVVVQGITQDKAYTGQAGSIYFEVRK